MTFKKYIQNESLDKLADAVNHILKELKKNGKVVPAHVTDEIRKALENKEDKDKIISRYWRTLGGQFDSHM